MPCHRVLPGITAMADMSEFLVETADQVLDGQPRGADGIAALSLAEQQNGYLSNRFLSKKGCWSNHFFEYLVITTRDCSANSFAVVFVFGSENSHFHTWLQNWTPIYSMATDLRISKPNTTRRSRKRISVAMWPGLHVHHLGFLPDGLEQKA